LEQTVPVAPVDPYKKRFPLQEALAAFSVKDLHLKNKYEIMRKALEEGEGAQVDEGTCCFFFYINSFFFSEVIFFIFYFFIFLFPQFELLCNLNVLCISPWMEVVVQVRYLCCRKVARYYRRRN
jgi:hypothetical protein